LPARSSALLFAYGTLMRGYGRHRFLAGAALVTTGHVRGRLLAFRGYPGLIAGAGRVRGEIYRLADPQLLPLLDREEGYNFVRRRGIATLAGGRRARVWLYRYRGPRERATPIPSGDYRATKPSPGRNSWR
jgi:gamma-glutamylcyclotransferase (GGCT)/AIG2-like uncharacterized protein YtfP